MEVEFSPPLVGLFVRGTKKTTGWIATCWPEDGNVAENKRKILRWIRMKERIQEFRDADLPHATHTPHAKSTGLRGLGL